MATGLAKRSMTSFSVVLSDMMTNSQLGVGQTMEAVSDE
jgi:hypothetical protein